VDPSRTIEDEMVTSRGLSAPVLRDILSRELSRGLDAQVTELLISRRYAGPGNSR